MTLVEDVLEALVVPTRRNLLDRLSVRGSATATTLSVDLAISRQAVVQHLGVLDRAGLVAGARHGRERWFEVRTDGLNETARWLEGLATDWDRRLTRIQQIAEASGSS